MTASKRQKTGLNTIVIICLKNLSPIYKQKLLEQLNMKQLIVKLNDTLSYQAITIFK